MIIFLVFVGQTVTTDLWILDTDYETFSLAYSCANIGTENRQGNLENCEICLVDHIKILKPAFIEITKLFMNKIVHVDIITYLLARTCVTLKYNLSIKIN